MSTHGPLAVTQLRGLHVTMGFGGFFGEGGCPFNN